MNDNLTKARPRRPRITQFKSVDDFWRYHTDHPEAFIAMDATGILEMAKKVRDRTQISSVSDRHPEPVEGAGRNVQTSDNKREFQREKTASKNGIGRELNGNSKASPSPPAWGEVGEQGEPGEGADNGSPSQRSVGYKSPPAEHRFQPGNPGGPGGPLGPRSMRKYIRMLLFGDEVDAGFAKDVTTALFFQAIKGNTHAIRIICENGNNRRKRV